MAISIQEIRIIIRLELLLVIYVTDIITNDSKQWTHTKKSTAALSVIAKHKTSVNIQQ